MIGTVFNLTVIKGWKDRNNFDLIELYFNFRLKKKLSVLSCIFFSVFVRTKIICPYGIMCNF